MIERTRIRTQERSISKDRSVTTRIRPNTDSVRSNKPKARPFSTDACCRWVTLATFADMQLTKIEYIHTGPECVGYRSTGSVAQWRRERGL
jgi:hypothetical protein